VNEKEIGSGGPMPPQNNAGTDTGDIMPIFVNDGPREKTRRFSFTGMLGGPIEKRVFSNTVI